jgi:hypothetical protein
LITTGKGSPSKKEEAEREKVSMTLPHIWPSGRHAMEELPNMREFSRLNCDELLYRTL